MSVMTIAASHDVLEVDDLSQDRFAALLDLAAIMKRHPTAWRDALEGRSVACLFTEPSTRERVSFQVAPQRLGAMPIMLWPDELELERGEPLADTARVLSGYCDAIVIRTPAHRDVLELAEHATVPVINARSDAHHPCQALSDCLTLRERFGGLEGLEIAYVGEWSSAARSLTQAAVLTGMKLRIATPRGHFADPVAIERAGTALRTFHDPREAVAGARAVYTAPGDQSCQVTAELMELAAPRAVFMHCLPARRGQEVTAEVIDGPASVVWQQAANHVPVEQALLRALVTGDWEA
jgi:ornithine carbamoyltransferase